MIGPRMSGLTDAPATPLLAARHTRSRIRLDLAIRAVPKLVPTRGAVGDRTSFVSLVRLSNRQVAFMFWKERTDRKKARLGEDGVPWAADATRSHVAKRDGQPQALGAGLHQPRAYIRKPVAPKI